MTLQLLDQYRPKGKWICVGDVLLELRIIQNYYNRSKAEPFPTLLITQNETLTGEADQTLVISEENIETDDLLYLLNADVLFFIINSNNDFVVNIVCKALENITNNDQIAIIIDVNISIDSRLIRQCNNYFSFNCSTDKGMMQFLTLIDSFTRMMSSANDNSLNSSSIDKSAIMSLFRKSKVLFYGVSCDSVLESALIQAINEVKRQLYMAKDDSLDLVDSIYFTLTSANQLTDDEREYIVKTVLRSFGKKLEVYFSDSSQGYADKNYYIVLILTDENRSEKEASIEMQSLFENLVNKTLENNLVADLIDNDKSELEEYDEKEHSVLLHDLFKGNEIYVFNEGGLPLFTSHDFNSNSEAFLYTGLFSAIETMSTDIIGHCPDQLVAGNKKLVFLNNDNLRGVAICNEGLEDEARKHLQMSLDLVQSLLRTGASEHTLNDKVHELLIQGHRRLREQRLNINYNKINYFAS